MVAFRSLAQAPADRDLAKSVQRILADHNFIAFRHVHVQARDGVVVLTGAVTSYYAKSLGFSLAQQVADAKGVVDAMTVNYPSRSTHALVGSVD